MHVDSHSQGIAQSFLQSWVEVGEIVNAAAPAVTKLEGINLRIADGKNVLYTILIYKA